MATACGAPFNDKGKTHCNALTGTSAGKASGQSEPGPTGLFSHRLGKKLLGQGHQESTKDIVQFA